MTQTEIDYALVEDTRPPIYTAMKYWGKKPHNIWREYVSHYTPEQGLVLDPFSGSCIAAFEAVKAGRKAVAFDLNPMSAFMIEVLSSDYDHDAFQKKVVAIVSKVENDSIYKTLFTSECPVCKSPAILQNTKRDKGVIYEVGTYCFNHGKDIEKSLSQPRPEDFQRDVLAEEITIPFWTPEDEFPSSPSFTASFIKNIGGSKFKNLWTNRNLYVISFIFDEIMQEKDPVLQRQLLFGFTQTIHLCTKMSVPRRSNANRPFSTSWGRSAYVCSSRQMEMNPLLVFEGSCVGKQSVESALKDTKEYLGKTPKVLYVDRSNRSNKTTNFDIKYGIIDIANLGDFVEPGSVDFVITDPPYGGLVQYLDLSLIWLVWLYRWDSRFGANLDAEITVKRGSQDIELYKKKFTNALKNIHGSLKDDGKLVLTFHNKDLAIWNAFLNSVVLAGFKIEKVIHQQNRRTGEANVANPYGTSASDFYIRCIKQTSVGKKTSREEFEHYVVTKAIQLIAQRNEPTPFQILFNGLLVEISSAGFDLTDFDKNIQQILSRHIGDIFQITENESDLSGQFWWLMNPSKYIKYPDRQLSDRVQESIIGLLRRKISVSLDEALAEIFVNYPNGLTPTVTSVTKILSRFATKSNDKWVYRGGEIEQEFTKHTEVIAKMAKLGKKLGFEIYIGKREQPEPYLGNRLAALADHLNLTFLRDDKFTRARLEMIDMLWIRNDEIAYAIEVENSTNFTSGIQRASNLNSKVPKLMIVPDQRVLELQRLRDRLFVDNFKHYSWSFMSYTDVERVIGLNSLSLEVLGSFGRTLD
jgi:DNA modification methylase